MFMNRFDIPSSAKVIGILAVLAGPSLLWANQAQELPKAENILERYIEVTGGKPAYKKLNNRIAQGKITMPEMGIEGKIKIYHVAPNKIRALTELAGMGEIDEGYNGDVAWEVSAMMGPRIKEGPEMAVVKRSSEFHSDINWRKHYKDARTVGVETVDGQKAYKVEMTPTEGHPEIRYYAKDSGLLLKASTKLPTPMGDLPVTSSFDDYREIDGIKVPYKLKQNVASIQKIEMDFSKIEHNVEIATDRFKPPPSVLALLSKGKDEEKDAETGKKEEQPAETTP